MKPKKTIQPPDYQYAWDEYGVTPKQVDAAAKRVLHEIAADRKAGRLVKFTGKLKRPKLRTPRKVTEVFDEASQANH